VLPGQGESGIWEEVDCQRGSPVTPSSFSFIMLSSRILTHRMLRPGSLSCIVRNFTAAAAATALAAAEGSGGGRLAQLPTLFGTGNVYAMSPEATKIFSPEDFLVVNDFITQGEHDQLVEEVTTRLKKMKYEPTHIDSVITGYRELALQSWTTPGNQAVVQRVLDLFIGENLKFLPVHALDLKEDGSIGSHVDNIEYSGGLIAGLSLLSEAVMRLQHEKNPDAKLEVVIKPRSLYIQR